MNNMLKRMLVICFLYLLSVGGYKMLGSVVRGL